VGGINAEYMGSFIIRSQWHLQDVYLTELT